MMVFLISLIPRDMTRPDEVCEPELWTWSSIAVSPSESCYRIVEFLTRKLKGSDLEPRLANM